MKFSEKKLSVYMFGLLVVYAIYWRSFGRVAGVPISYLPYFMIFIGFIVVWIKNIRPTMHKSDVWLLVSILYFLIQPLFLSGVVGGFSYLEYAKDMLMFLIYFIAYIAISTGVSRINVHNKLDLLDKVSDLIATATVIGIVRYIAVDLWWGGGSFFNIVPPLQYRFFEILLFLLGFSISAVSYVLRRTKKHKYYILLFLLGTFLSGSRTGMLVILFSAAIVFLWSTKRIKFNMLLSGGILIALLFSLNSIVGGKMADRFSRISEIGLFVNVDMNAAIEQKKNVKRILYISGGLTMFMEQPWFGVGLGNFQERFPSELMQDAGVQRVTRPHNMYISILATAGLIGFVLFFGWLVSLWFELKSKMKKYPLDYGLLYRPAFIFLTSMFVFFFGYEVETNPLYWGIMGVLMGVTRNDYLETSRRTVRC